MLVVVVLVVSGLTLPSGVLLKVCSIVPDATVAKGKQDSSVQALLTLLVVASAHTGRQDRLAGKAGCTPPD